MKILLFGEYNRSHLFLKEGLMALGHEVVTAGIDDGFKKISLDIFLEPVFFKKRLPHYLRMAVFKLFKQDLANIEIYYRFKNNKRRFSGFDVVQLINEFPLQIHPFLEKKCLAFLFQNNKKTILSACGDDTVYIDYILNENLEYHLLEPYLKNNALKKHYKHSLSYLKSNRRKLHQFVFKHINKVIPQDFDYYMAYKNHPKSTGLIPHPINLSYFEFSELKITDKIVIFHGINRFNYYKKGNNYFEEAMQIIQSKYANKVEIITAENLPYKDYIKAFNSCHILLDQVLSYDQGYNALEAMAKGKVVFSGAEKDWLQHFNLKENTVLFNTKPNAEMIASDLEFLILNPEKLSVISRNAREFVATHHDNKIIASKFINAYTI